MRTKRKREKIHRKIGLLSTPYNVHYRKKKDGNIHIMHTRPIQSGEKNYLCVESNQLKSVNEDVAVRRRGRRLREDEVGGLSDASFRFGK